MGRGRYSGREGQGGRVLTGRVVMKSCNFTPHTVWAIPMIKSSEPSSRSTPPRLSQSCHNKSRFNMTLARLLFCCAVFLGLMVASNAFAPGPLRSPRWTTLAQSPARAEAPPPAPAPPPPPPPPGGQAAGPSFRDLAVDLSLLYRLDAQRLLRPTPVQLAAIAATRGGARTQLLIAPTGSGKTLAYFLPALMARVGDDNVDGGHGADGSTGVDGFGGDGVRGDSGISGKSIVSEAQRYRHVCLVVAPTRELAVQLAADLRALLPPARAARCSGGGGGGGGSGCPGGVVDDPGASGDGIGGDGSVDCSGEGVPGGCSGERSNEVCLALASGGGAMSGAGPAELETCAALVGTPLELLACLKACGPAGKDFLAGLGTVVSAGD